MSSEDSMRGAFAALLRGDTAERDRLCKRAEIEIEMEARSRTIERVLAVDFYVSEAGKIYSSREMFRAAN